MTLVEEQNSHVYKSTGDECLYSAAFYLYLDFITRL